MSRTSPESHRFTVGDLLPALGRVLEAVEARYGEEVPLAGGDYYWNVSTRDAFDLREPPSEFTVGDVADDAQSIRNFVARPLDEPVTIWHELAHISGVLRAIEHLDRDTERAGPV